MSIASSSVSRDEPERMQADRQLRLPELLEGALVELDVAGEALGIAADDRQHQRQAEAGGPHDRLRAAADAHPGRDVAVRDRRADELVGQRRAELARPGDGLVAQQAHEQVELLFEQLLVVGEVESEQREGLRQRAAADDQLRPAAGHRVERGEVVVQPHRVLRAEHRHRGTEPDPLGTAGDRREDHVARRVHELRPVVLADVERVDSDRLGEDRLLDGVADHLVAGDRAARSASTVTGRKVSRPNSKSRAGICALFKFMVRYHVVVYHCGK